jgi:hypothetical protein
MIDAVELIGVRISSDGKHLRLRVRDQGGQAMTLSFPSGWLNRMLNVLPQSPGPDSVHSLDSWSMDRTSKGQDLILTLRTPEGQTVSFVMKPWQIEGMATIATYGNTLQTSAKTLH